MTAQNEPDKDNNNILAKADREITQYNLTHTHTCVRAHTQGYKQPSTTKNEKSMPI